MPKKYIRGIKQLHLAAHDKTTTRGTRTLAEAQGLRGKGFTLDIWLKSAKPSALLKDPLPKGSKVPKGPASSTSRGRVTGHSQNTPPGSRGKCHLLVLNGPQSRRSMEVTFV